MGSDPPTCPENDGVPSWLLRRLRLLSLEPDAKGRGRRLLDRRLLLLQLLPAAVAADEDGARRPATDVHRLFSQQRGTELQRSRTRKRRR